MNRETAKENMDSMDKKISDVAAAHVVDIVEINISVLEKLAEDIKNEQLREEDSQKAQTTLNTLHNELKDSILKLYGGA